MSFFFLNLLFILTNELFACMFGSKYKIKGKKVNHALHLDNLSMNKLLFEPSDEPNTPQFDELAYEDNFEIK